MNENWYALCIAIVLKTPPETAFRVLNEGNINRTSLLTFDDTKDMIKFRDDGMKFREIGDMYGITESAVYKRIKYYKDKKDRSTAMETATSNKGLKEMFI